MNTLFDPLFLSRVQFALTIMFHILFPTLTIGLGLYLVVIETLWLRTGKELYYRIYRFWARIFGINFSVGVVSGVIMAFEFGTNWARFSFQAANVFSPLLYYEVMTAFFLEAGFLGIMLFGWKRVGRIFHFLATVLVATGAVISAFWILAANSWMQTPAGYTLVDGKFVVTSFIAAVFNPSFPYRFGHMVVAGFETAVFAVAGVSAYFLLKERDQDFHKHCLSVALLLAALFAPLQVYLGDAGGREVFRSQPAKLAAIESHWETNTQGGAPLVLFGIPDRQNERTRFEVAVPNGLSLLLTQSLNGRIRGLKEFPREDRPNALIVFSSFRIMAGIGFLFLFTMIWAGILRQKGRLFTCQPFLWTLIGLQPLGWVATELGWVTAEAGRQPWLVYNVLKVSQGLSPIPAANVLWSLSLFIIIFIAVGASYFHLVLKVLRAGPDLTSPIPVIHRPAGIKNMKGSVMNSGEGI